MKYSTQAILGISLLLVLTFLGSCSKGGGGGGGNPATELKPQAPEAVELSGIYHAKLVAVNPQVTGDIAGKVNLSRLDENLTIYIDLNEPTPGLIHEQKLYSGTTCPGPEQDLNQDGFIDAFENRTFMGSALAPLDKDISSVEAGYNYFPPNFAEGGYWYEQIVNYQAFLDDLATEDENLNDDYVKLSGEKSFEVDSLVVMVLGVPKEKNLPFSVRSINGWANFQTFPIACGVLKKVKTTPGRVAGDIVVDVPTGPTGGAAGSDDGIDPTVVIPEGSVVTEEPTGEVTTPEAPAEIPEPTTVEPGNYGDDEDIIVDG